MATKFELSTMVRLLVPLLLALSSFLAQPIRATHQQQNEAVEQQKGVYGRDVLLALAQKQQPSPFFHPRGQQYQQQQPIIPYYVNMPLEWEDSVQQPSMDAEENEVASEKAKRAQTFVRFGKRAQTFVRFGKRAQTFVRFGRDVRHAQQLQEEKTN